MLECARARFIVVGFVVVVVVVVVVVFVFVSVSITFYGFDLIISLK